MFVQLKSDATNAMSLGSTRGTSYVKSSLGRIVRGIGRAVVGVPTIWPLALRNVTTTDTFAAHPWPMFRADERNVQSIEVMKKQSTLLPGTPGSDTMVAVGSGGGAG
jgi:hypothetical protein